MELRDANTLTRTVGAAVPCWSSHVTAKPPESGSAATLGKYCWPSALALAVPEPDTVPDALTERTAML